MKQKYSDEEKQKIIGRYISGGESSANILADTGIPKSTFYSWLKVYREKQVNSKRKPINIRNFHLLENKVVRLEGIIEILQSVTCTAKSPLKEKLYAAEQLHGKYNVHMICDALNIPEVHFTTIFSVIRKIILGILNAKKNCVCEYRRSMMKTIKFSEQVKLPLLCVTKASK